MIGICVFTKLILKLCLVSLYNADQPMSKATKFLQARPAKAMWQASERRPAEFEGLCSWHGSGRSWEINLDQTDVLTHLRHSYLKLETEANTSDQGIWSWPPSSYPMATLCEHQGWDGELGI